MTPAPVVSMFKASDGRPFEVRWASEANSRELWHWNNSHYPGPLTPLHAWVMGHGTGRDRAYAEAGIDPPAFFRQFEIHQNFHFTRQSPYQGEQLASFVAKSRALAGRYGGACNVFEAFSLPRIEAAIGAIQDAPVSTPMDELADLFGYIFHMTHVAGPAVFAPIQARLTALLSTRFAPDEAALLAQEVGQGSESATVDSDREIARLAALARESRALEAAVKVRSHDALSAIAAAEVGEEFRGALASYLHTYGLRTERWGIDAPTLAERPELVIDMVRQSMATPRDEEALRRAALAVRTDALAKIAAMFHDDPETLGAVRAIAAELERYVFVREGRALRQLIGAGSLRGAIQRKGDVMAAAGAIAERDDVFFLLPGEIDPFFGKGGASADLRALVANRRREHDSWAGVKPPSTISADPAVLGAEAGAQPDSPSTIRGLPGSRGIAQGKARVIGDLDAGDELQPGEIMVCVMTSPPWTPLFAVAAAIVTDSGYALSHSAIAAREYGIPAVVGAHRATVRIKTGDTVTVDGDAGTVTIVQRA